MRCGPVKVHENGDDMGEREMLVAMFRTTFSEKEFRAPDRRGTLIIMFNLVSTYMLSYASKLS